VKQKKRTRTRQERKRTPGREKVLVQKPQPGGKVKMINERHEMERPILGAPREKTKKESTHRACAPKMPMLSRKGKRR